MSVNQPEMEGESREALREGSVHKDVGSRQLGLHSPHLLSWFGHEQDGMCQLEERDIWSTKGPSSCSRHVVMASWSVVLCWDDEQLGGQGANQNYAWLSDGLWSLHLSETGSQERTPTHILDQS